jgi:hypothetical protein
MRQHKPRNNHFVNKPKIPHVHTVKLCAEQREKTHCHRRIRGPRGTFFMTALNRPK